MQFDLSRASSAWWIIIFHFVSVDIEIVVREQDHSQKCNHDHTECQIIGLLYEDGVKEKTLPVPSGTDSVLKVCIENQKVTVSERIFRQARLN